jgi:hypothetical protein
MIDRRLLFVLVAGPMLACRIEVTSPTPTQTTTVTVEVPETPPTPPTPNPPSPSPPTPPPGTPTPVPLPSYGAGVLQSYAASPTGAAHLATSCQATHGAAAWAFLDGLLGQLRAVSGDPRWGYVCRSTCADLSGDVIAYLGSGVTPSPGARGTWGVDVIGGHCGSMPAATWNVLGYDAAGTWTGTRGATF